MVRFYSAQIGLLKVVILVSVCLFLVVLEKNSKQPVRRVERKTNKDPTCKNGCQGTMNRPCDKEHMSTAQPDIVEDADFHCILTVSKPERKVTRVH